MNDLEQLLLLLESLAALIRKQIAFEANPHATLEDGREIDSQLALLKEQTEEIQQLIYAPNIGRKVAKRWLN